MTESVFDKLTSKMEAQRSARRETGRGQIQYRPR